MHLYSGASVDLNFGLSFGPCYQYSGSQTTHGDLYPLPQLDTSRPYSSLGSRRIGRDSTLA